MQRDARIIEHPKGRLAITPMSANSSLFVLSGQLEDALARGIIDEGSRISLRGGAIAFHDWSGLTSYSSEARRLCTDWMLANRKGFERCTILVSSAIVAMGVNVANLALGGFLDAGTDAEAFAAALRQHQQTLQPQ